MNQRLHDEIAALKAAVAEERARLEQWATDRIGATQSRGYEYNAGWNQAMSTLVDKLRALAWEG